MVVQTTVWLIAMAAILFVAAGDWGWPQGWISWGPARCAAAAGRPCAPSFAKPAPRCHIASMNRRSLLAAVLLLPFAGRPARAETPPALSPQDQADVTRIEAYLNGLHTLKAHFLQVAPTGAVAQGTAWLERPGRMRFQYDPPSPLLLVAGHGLVVFHDQQLNQTTNIPLGQTPLGILLAPDVKLSGAVTITGLRRQPGQLEISLVRTASPADGTLVLTFADNPLVLRQWEVIDAQRQATRVTLYNVQLGGSFDPKLFEYTDPRLFQQPSGSNG